MSIAGTVGVFYLVGDRPVLLTTAQSPDMAISAVRCLRVRPAKCWISKQPVLLPRIVPAPPRPVRDLLWNKVQPSHSPLAQFGEILTGSRLSNMLGNNTSAERVKFDQIYGAVTAPTWAALAAPNKRVIVCECTKRFINQHSAEFHRCHCLRPFTGQALSIDDQLKYWPLDGYISSRSCECNGTGIARVKR